MTPPEPAGSADPAVLQSGGWFDWVIRVRYSETDAQRIVHHANYLVYMEEARTELVRALGVPYKEMEERGCSIVVAGAECSFRASAVFDDLIRVRTRVERVRSREVSFQFRLEDAQNGRLLAEGRTRHVFVDGSGKVITGPEWIVRGLQGDGRPRRFQHRESFASRDPVR